MATKTKKPTAAKSTAPLPPPVASVELVPLDRIDVLPQVRTEFDQESLQELARDIQARGLLQPVLLNPHLDRFTLIAGERRLRACRLAGLAAIPALITKASAEEAEDMQLAENVQREQLNLADTAKAVRRLFDRLGSLQAVADRVKKSKPWVSKHLAVTCAGFCWTARRLLEDGVSEDLELLTVVSKLEHVDYQATQDLARAIRGNKAGRKEAQAALKAAKEKKKQCEKKAAEKRAKTAAKTSAPPAPTLEDALYGLADWILDDDQDALLTLQEVKAPISDAVLQELDTHLVVYWSAGVATRDKGIGATAETGFLWLHVCNYSQRPKAPEHAAWLQGVAGQDFDLDAALENARRLILRFHQAEAADHPIQQPEASA